MPLKLYTCIVFYSAGERRVRVMHNVSDVKALGRWCKRENEYANYINVYDPKLPKGSNFIERYKIE